MERIFTDVEFYCVVQDLEDLELAIRVPRNSPNLEHQTCNVHTTNQLARFPWVSDTDQVVCLMFDVLVFLNVFIAFDNSVPTSQYDREHQALPMMPKSEVSPL